LALAQNYLMTSRFEEAEVASDQARRLDPYSLFVDWYSGAVHAWLGRFREAVPHLERAVARQPGFIPPHSVLAWCWIELGDEPAARAEAEKVRDISPGWSVREMENRIPITSPETWERMVEALTRLGLG
jgi:tetratricopeptide (TPR) repeat protein